ncbi:helix-turn-helix protein [Mucilaginibacter yixingensis]|uniref:Helix-turn-helix protein n=1 Tax=Mucilaginibacter yixingensis TaxID=1295612 RepID=A0A2T5JBP4_9SPHI|nr:helix-turn-helix domain-containing protein [Mucilaginibacter yixingensis]PTQ99193.1 helix-turn-helix protein [Mucilaginibacter yixingensis]
MSYWGSNVRFLRKRAGLSQDALAGTLSMTRVKLNAHENGKTSNPTVSDLVAVSNHFAVSIDNLLRLDLAGLTEKELNDLERPKANMRVLAISVDEQNDEYIEYVPVKAKAGYTTGHRDPDYIAALPKYRFPGLAKGKTFRLFPTTGDSMVPVPEGSDVLAAYVADWQAIKAETLCIVIMRSEQDFVFKQVTLIGKDRLQLKSLNEQYEPYLVKLEEVLEIWEFDRYISRVVPLQRTELDDIKSLLLDMRRDLKRNKN